MWILCSVLFVWKSHETDKPKRRRKERFRERMWLRDTGALRSIEKPQHKNDIQLQTNGWRRKPRRKKNCEWTKKNAVRNVEWSWSFYHFRKWERQLDLGMNKIPVKVNEDCFPEWEDCFVELNFNFYFLVLCYFQWKNKQINKQTEKHNTKRYNPVVTNQNILLSFKIFFFLFHFV